MPLNQTHTVCKREKETEGNKAHGMHNLLNTSASSQVKSVGNYAQ